MTHERGLLDTSALIGDVAADSLPGRVLISSLSLAELAAGPLAARDPAERASRQQRLQHVESTFDPLPFDVSAARAYVQVYAAVRSVGRQPRGRIVDLYIASVAVAHDLPLYTRNAGDLRGLEQLLTVVAVSEPLRRTGDTS